MPMQPTCMRAHTPMLPDGLSACAARKWALLGSQLCLATTATRLASATRSVVDRQRAGRDTAKTEAPAARAGRASENGRVRRPGRSPRGTWGPGPHAAGKRARAAPAAPCGK